MGKKSTYKSLLEPGYIGNVKTRNRIIKTGAGLQMWHHTDTRINKRLLSYYESLARGGVGLIIVESPAIDFPRGARWPERYRIDDDKYINGLAELVDTIHQHGCPAFMQMNHDGPWQVNIPFVPEPLFDGKPLAASPVMFASDNDFHNELPKEMTKTDIAEIVDKFASAAVRASKAGFDGVDINAASSHLFHNFLSPFWNRRTDEYGGSPENRARFPMEVIREIKQRLGEAFPISVCINGLEVGQLAGIKNSQCLSLNDARSTAKLLETAGADMIQVRSHWLGYHVGAYLPDVFFYPEAPIPIDSFPKEYDHSGKGVGANIPLATAIKKDVSIPVMVVGKLDPKLGDRILDKGSVDFIGMTRRLQADPDMPKKLGEGQDQMIAPCTACENCLGTQRCRINAFLGKEVNQVSPASQQKKVVVIGGGPAGMSAARVAALRGHEVTLFDKLGKLGGLLPIATLVKGTDLEDLPELIRYFSLQLSSLGVRVQLGREVSPADIKSQNPDAVIVATGGQPVVPVIPGIESSHVITGPALYGRLRFLLKFVSPQLLRRLTKLYLPVGRRVIIIGGGIQGCELAEFLTKRNRKVVIVDQAETMGTDMVDVLMGHLFMWFDRKGVERVCGVKDYKKIDEKGLTIIEKDGAERVIPADTIIPALPLAPDDDLYRSLITVAPEVYSVGDCGGPGLIADAIAEGSDVSLTI